MMKTLMKLIHVLCSITYVLCSHFSTDVASREIPLGSILHAFQPDSAWSSSNNKFTLAFIPPSDSSSSSSSSLVASINHATVSVWQAGGSNAVVDSAGHFCLHASGDLRLVTGSKVTIWSSGTSGLGVTCAVLEDSGNFVLKNGSVPVWSTFDNPTDTLLPLQNLTVNKVLQSGIYSLNLTQSGDVVLKWNDSVEYWNLGYNDSTNAIKPISPSLSILPVGILAISDRMLSSPVKVVFGSDYGEESDDRFQFLKLDSDGNLRIYSSSKSGIITQQWAALPDQCLVFGYCGDMGICSYNGSLPACGCASQNFVPIDEKDSRKGCKRKLEIKNCTESMGIVQLEHTKFLTYGHGLVSQIFFTASTACRLNCLTNPTCVASSSLSDGSGHCYSKTPGFLSGYHSPAFPGASYIKVCGDVLYNTNSGFLEITWKANGNKISVWISALAVFCVVLGVFLLECAVWCCWKKCSKNGALSAPDALLQYASGSPIRFSYKEVEKSTKGFADKLGEGGFGIVYRGSFGNKSVAVKRLEGIKHGEKHLIREVVAVISSTHHLNLVKLIGFCWEGRHRLLVYEFMKNGSLASFLFDSEGTSKKLLTWDVRFRIAIGTARGITYLHEACRDCIVHCDVKPENILLDDKYNAKVSDFGLAKLKKGNGCISGPGGYQAPEWPANLPLTSRFDVYSFGMVLLEIVSGRRNLEVVDELHNKQFWEWAYEEYEKGNAEAILDKRLVVGDEGVDMEQVMRAIQVSFWCIQEQPSARPTMGEVVQMLEGVFEIENPPAPKTTQQATTTSLPTLSVLSPSAPSPSFSFPILEKFH